MVGAFSFLSQDLWPISRRVPCNLERQKVESVVFAGARCRACCMAVAVIVTWKHVNGLLFWSSVGILYSQSLRRHVLSRFLQDNSSSIADCFFSINEWVNQNMMESSVGSISRKQQSCVIGFLN